MKLANDYRVDVHGVDHPQYYPGCSAVHTRFHEVGKGIGLTVEAAFNDALESLAESGWDVDKLEGKSPTSDEHEPYEPEDLDDECQYFVEVYVANRVVVLDNGDHDHDITVHVCGDGAGLWASEDQSIAGSNWERDGDDFGYTIIGNRDDLVAVLAAEGYELNLDAYSPPD